MFYAHSKKEEPREQWQLLKEHLENTARICAEFAGKFGLQELGYIAGMLHDIGKYSMEFQRRLEGQRIHVDHSSAGLQEVFKLYADKKSLAKILGFVISGHHTGLPNGGSINQEGSLCYRLNKKNMIDYSVYREEISVPEINQTKLPIKLTQQSYFSIYLLIKMLYSCLVDADFLDTEFFMDKDKRLLRNNFSKLEDLSDKLDAYLTKLALEADPSEVNKYRQVILEDCREKALSEPGFFTLTVPTGGGKTLSSMAFALRHALKNDLDRIIYVIPYTSIIEQNADRYREIFGAENVLEHHCNYGFEQDKEDFSEISEKLKLAAENWDMPIVVTTNVQFFESIFSNRSSKCRRLHNLSRSVIILDEAQMLPVKLLKLSLMALCELVRNYKTTVVFCTATQPNIKEANLLPNDIDIREIAGQPEMLYQKFRRTKIVDIGEIDDEKLADKLKQHSQVLCIVNRKEHARRLYIKLNEQEKDSVFHLSTYMYPLHRKQTIKKIKEKLNNKEDCVVISTQLIEAGVDIDFPVVYRALAGIDSIAQAAGRCNREGKKAVSNVYVFRPTEKHGQPPNEIQVNASTSESVFRHIKDPMSLEGINRYFALLYDVKNTDYKNLVGEIKEKAKTLDYPFADISDNYKIIEESTVSIIIPGDDICKEYLSQLRFSPVKRHIIRKLQPYMVNVYDHELKKLLETGGVEHIEECNCYVLSNLELFYDNNVGIIIDGEEKLQKSFLNV